MVAEGSVCLVDADPSEVGAMSTWDDLDAKFFGAAGGEQKPAGNWDDLDRKFFATSTRRFPGEKEKAAPVTDFAGTLKFGPLDTGIAMPEGVNRRLAQLGSGFADWTLRAQQLLGNASTQDVAEKRARDATLRDDFTGKALGVAGQAAPSFALPFVGSAPVLSGMAAGAVTGFMQPVGEGESAVANTALGAALGGAIPGAVGGLKWLTRPTPDMVKTAGLAYKHGIPVGASDLSRNGFVKSLQSFANDMPIGGIPSRNLRAAQEDAFTKAVGKTFGAAETRLTPEVVDAAKKTMGAEFDRLWGRNVLEADPQMMTKLMSLREAAADMPKAQGRQVMSAIDDFLSRFQPNEQGAAIVSGDVANSFQSWIRKQASGSDGYTRELLADTRKAIIGAFNRSISPDDAAALAANMSKYKAFKTVSPLLDKGVVGTAGRAEGVVPPSLLSEAVRKSYGDLSSQTSQPALAELAQVGGRMLVDRAPQTGGSARALIQNNPILASLFGMGTLPINYALSSQALARSGLSQPRGLLGGSSARDALREAGLLGVSRSPLLLPGLFLSPAAEQ